MEAYLYGLNVLYIENQWLKVGILLDKGADIFEIKYKPLNMEVMLKTSKGLSLFEGRDIKKNKLKNYNELYFGGWQDLVPHKCSVNGSLKDISASNSSCLPWEYEVIEDCNSILAVKFIVDLITVPIRLEKTLTLYENSPQLHIDERILNLGEESINFSWTHHTAFGGELINENTIIEYPKAMAFNVSAFERDRTKPIQSFVEPINRVTTNTGSSYNLTKVYPRGKGDRVYTIIKDMQGDFATIFNKKSKVGFKFEWDGSIFKYLRYWAQNDENIYTVALEPSSTCFNDFEDTLKHQLDIMIKPGEEKRSFIKCSFHESEAL